MLNDVLTFALHKSSLIAEYRKTSNSILHNFAPQSYFQYSISMLEVPENENY